MTVRTSRGLVQLARCRLILDTKKCKIKFKVHKSAALALVIPGAVTKAVLALNTALSCLPLQTKSSIVKALDANKVLTAGSSIDDVTTQDDVSNDEMFEDDVIDPEKAPNEAAFTAPCKLFSTILKVDVEIICPRNVVVEFKKREILASLKRQSGSGCESKSADHQRTPRNFKRETSPGSNDSSSLMGFVLFAI